MSVRSIFPTLPLSIKQALPKSVKYTSPSLPNNTYKLALDLLSTEKTRLESEIDTLNSNKSLKEETKTRLIEEKQIELGYLDMQNHFDFQHFRGMSPLQPLIVIL